MPEQRRHLVYLASNMDGLELERYEVERVLARHGITCVGFACPPEGVEYDWDLARQQVELADAFILLVGDDYGQMLQTGISLLHREYVHARTLDLPVFAFLKNLPTDTRLDQNQSRLKGFYQLITQSTTPKHWHLRDQLLTHVKNQMKAIQGAMGEGWFKAEPQVKESPTETKIVKAPTPKPHSAVTMSARERIELNRKTVNLLVEAKVYQGGNLSREELVLPARLDQLFRALQNSFSNETSEDRVRGHLESVIAETVRRKLLEKNANAHAVDDIRISKTQFRSILEAWQQLGQVTMSSRSGRDYWRAVSDHSKAISG